MAFRGWLGSARRCSTAVAVGVAASCANAATFTVTQLGETGPGSIREAIIAANALPGPDSIVFNAPTTSNFTLLRSALPAITDDLTIVGPNAQYILARDAQTPGVPDFSVLSIDGSPTVILRRFTISNGRGVDGGGISARGGSLTLDNISILNNSASARGGGVYLRGASAASLTIIDSSITNNRSIDSGGGVCLVVESGAATLLATNSTIARNSITAPGPGRLGAGLFISGPGAHTLTITACTIADNAISLAGAGGGVHADSLGGATLTLTNCTVSGNVAGTGAAASVENTLTTLASCTVYANSSSSGPTSGVVRNVGGQIVSRNTILSGNISGGTLRDLADLQPIDARGTLVGAGGAVANGINSNIVGVTDPRLVPMGDNGGPTQTFALRPGSRAIDAGEPSGFPALDQRGQPRPSDGDNDGTARVDIGAFEAQRYLVITVADAGTGSLREAITANNAAGGGFVKFAIGAIGQARTISPTAALTPIVRTIFLDGWSQGGNAYSGPPLIALSGAAAGPAIGLDLQANDSQLRGLSIGGFGFASGQTGVGLRISSRAGVRNWVYGCHIGAGLDGIAATPNAQAGVWLAPSANTNLIGTNADGVDDALERNIIGGSTLGVGAGVYVQSNSNVIAGNYIGLGANGVTPLSNSTGVAIVAGTSNRVGASTISAAPAAERNFVCGNSAFGLSLSSQGSNNQIAGNSIGLRPDGITALPNGVGVLLDDVTMSVIGGRVPSITRNLISGNTLQGVLVRGSGALGNSVWGNYIGTAADGRTPVGNGAAGVLVTAGASFTRIGSLADGSPTDANLGNVIGGNAGRGIEIHSAGPPGGPGTTSSNAVRGNLIGIGADGRTEVGNFAAGVSILNSPSNQIGSPGGGRNIIGGQRSSTTGVGVEILGPASVLNTVSANLIGLNAQDDKLSNAAAGVLIAQGASSNTVGGLIADEGNVIAYNAGPGVLVRDDATLLNPVLRNSIFLNGALGIDLNADGVTPNASPLVARVGPNSLQNYPLLTGVSSGGQISATLAAKASTAYRVEFFSSPSRDDSLFGEGRTFLGTVTVTTGPSGLAGPFGLSFMPSASEPWITATATELASASRTVLDQLLPAGSPLSSSEFSLARVINSDPDASPQQATGLEDTDLLILLSGTDPDPSDPLAFSIATLPSTGQLLQLGTLAPISANDPVTDPTGRVVYRPAPNAFGLSLASFDFTASDGLGTSAPASVTISMAPAADTPGATPATTFQSQQTASGLVITRNPVDGPEVTHFKIVGITNGQLFLADGTAPVSDGSFITASQAASGLKFTPADRFIGATSFNIIASLGPADAGLGGAPAVATITVQPRGFTPSVSPATTIEDTQSTSGLTITRNVLNGPEITHYKITAIASGRVYFADGTTEVTNGAFIPAAQGAAGLRFTPTLNTFGIGTFLVTASVAATDAGLGGAPASAVITVAPVADTPSITGATTPQSQQTASGLVITRNPADGVEVSHFKLIGTAGGRVFLADGLTQLAIGQFITAAQAAAGLRFTPTDAFVGNASVTVRASIGPSDSGLGGDPATATIIVTPRAFTPSVSSATTIEDTQSSAGLVVSRSVLNGPEVTHFKVSGISGGRLYLSDGLSEITSGEFIAAGQGSAGLRFTPTADSFAPGAFTAQASISPDDSGLGGTPALASILVTPVADTPTITSASTRRNQQSTSGLVIARNAVDSTEVSHFKIDGIDSGRLFLSDGLTEILAGSFITAAQGSSGLRFTPALDFVGSASVRVRASIGATDSGLGGQLAMASINVLNVALTPTITGASTIEDTQSTSGLVVLPGVGDAGVTTHFKVIGVTSGRLYRTDGVTEITAGTFISAVQGAAGLRFTPDADFFGPASIRVQAASGPTDADLGGDVATAPIVVAPVADTPTITDASTFEGVTTTSGLVISRNAVDGPEVTHFKIIGVGSGTLLLSDSLTPVATGSFVTAAQAATGLRLRPDTEFFGDATVSVRASLGPTDAGLGGSIAAARVIVTAINQAPSFSAVDPPATIQGPRTVTISAWAGGFNPGRPSESGQTVLAYLVDQVSDPAFFSASPAISPSGRLTYATAGTSLGTATFRVRVRDSGGTANGGIDTSAPTTITVTVRPAAVCRDVTIDARSTCVGRTVSASQIDATSIGSGPAPTITFSRSLSQPFPIGTSNITVTHVYPDGLRTSCTARVTVLGNDCNANGVPDACDIASGADSDCNADGIPDSCQCAWDNGSQDPAQAAMANGQLSHEGGGAGAGVKTLDDFYLRPGSMYRMLSFRGQMLTNVLPVVRKARLELYEGCDGAPNPTPFKVLNNSQIISTVAAIDGFDLVTYSFNLCAEELWLEGGKTYYVALVGSNNATDADLSFWVTTTPGNNPAMIMGQTPFKRFATPGSPGSPAVYGPWQYADDCCGGCANVSYAISAEECKILWDNGRPELSPALAGGSPSGADGTTLPAPRTADNFIVPPCKPADVCYLEATIFTNCNPVIGFAEIYGNDCSSPLTTPLFTARASKVTALGVSATVDGSLLPGFTLTFTNPGWTLEPGKTYWLSVGATASGSATRRTVMAYTALNCADTGCQFKISPGRVWRPANAATPWAQTQREYAFRIAVRSPLAPGSPVQAPTVCRADTNGDGTAGIDDVFLFLTTWFAGCP